MSNGRAVDGAIGYTLRVSPTNMFTRLIKEVKLPHQHGSYGIRPRRLFWTSAHRTRKKKPANFTETFKFSLFAQGKTQEMMLEIESPQIQGHSAGLSVRPNPALR